MAKAHGHVLQDGAAAVVAMMVSTTIMIRHHPIHHVHRDRNQRLIRLPGAIRGVRVSGPAQQLAPLEPMLPISGLIATTGQDMTNHRLVHRTGLEAAVAEVIALELDHPDHHQRPAPLATSLPGLEARGDVEISGVRRSEDSSKQRQVAQFASFKSWS